MSRGGAAGCAVGVVLGLFIGVASVWLLLHGVARPAEWGDFIMLALGLWPPSGALLGGLYGWAIGADVSRRSANRDRPAPPAQRGDDP